MKALALLAAAVLLLAGGAAAQDCTLFSYCPGNTCCTACTAAACTACPAPFKFVDNQVSAEPFIPASESGRFAAALAEVGQPQVRLSASPCTPLPTVLRLQRRMHAL